MGIQPANIASGDSQCFAYLNSSTTSKASTSQAILILGERGAVMTCTGWLESSKDNGNTWEAATPTYSVTSSSWMQYAFSSAVGDGTAQLVRACVQRTSAKVCTAAW